MAALPITSALAAIAATQLPPELAMAGIVRAVEIHMGSWAQRGSFATAQARDESFDPFEELQSVHAAVAEAGGNSSTAKGVRDYLRQRGKLATA
jgi:hypothetical protein